MPRRAVPADLPCPALPACVLVCAWACALLGSLTTGATASAHNPIPSAPSIEEQVHEVEIEIDRDGATLRVTRSLFNPTLFHTLVELPIELPCEAVLAGLEVQELGPSGSLVWRPTELLAPDDAQSRFESYSAGPDDPNAKVAGNADTAVLMTRESGWSCDAELKVYPVPPLQTRSMSYRLALPSHYAEGRYTIELPSLDNYGLTPTLVVEGFTDSSLRASIDAQELGASGTALDGARSHTIVLTPTDAGRGRARAVDLDIETLIAATPAALAQLEPDQTTNHDFAPRLLETRFEAPAELAQLPPVRRAVIVLDASRSLADHHREQLQAFGAAYFQAIAEHGAQVEVLVFDREVRRVFHDFVPATWGAEDLPKIDVQTGNGSEVGQAIAAARELLAESSARAGTDRIGADWILVLSDLELRSDFDLGAEADAAAASPVRVHVVRRADTTQQFQPAPATDPWTAIARTAGGMAWEATDGAAGFADELVRPQRLWNLGLELEFADASHHTEALDLWLSAGELREWSNHHHGWRDAGLTRAAFVGEVWGQRRAWTASPNELEARRTAGALATFDANDELSPAARTALAYYAGVISPFTSAWALASFAGTAAAPIGTPMLYGQGLGGVGYGSRCGGVTRCSGGPLRTAVGFRELASVALNQCNIKGDGSYAFETTKLEIVAVDSPNRCITAQTWATDIRPTRAEGRKRITIEYAGGDVTRVVQTVL